MKRLGNGWMVGLIVLIAFLQFSLPSCAPLTKKVGLLKIYNRPPLPKVDWVMREVGYMSIRTEEYDSLRGYVISMEGVLNKYEGQSVIMNGD